MFDLEVLTVSAQGGPSILISEAARSSDLDSLVEAALSLGEEYYGPARGGNACFHRAWLQIALAGHSTYLHALKEPQGTIAGMGALERSEDNSREATLHSVWVSPRYRGLHLGRHVVIKALARARTMDYLAVVMDHTTNPLARRLYETLGFVSNEKGMRLDLSTVAF